MPRYIDADALIDFLDVGHLRHPSDLCFSEIDVANLLLHAPTISPDDVRGVGEWEDAKQYGLKIKFPVDYIERPSACPLHELPQHGDLIDRDALPQDRVEWEDVVNAPVIVPAEREGET